MEDGFSLKHTLFAQTPLCTSNTEPVTSDSLFSYCFPLINLTPDHFLRLNSHEPNHMVLGFIQKQQDLNKHHFALLDYQNTAFFILQPMVLMDALNGD